MKCSECGKKPATVDLWDLAPFIKDKKHSFFEILYEGSYPTCVECGFDILNWEIDHFSFSTGILLYKSIKDEKLKGIVFNCISSGCPDCGKNNLLLVYDLEEYAVLKKIQQEYFESIGIPPDISDSIHFCYECACKREKEAVDNPDPDTLALLHDEETVLLHRIPRQENVEIVLKWTGDKPE